MAFQNYLVDPKYESNWKVYWWEPKKICFSHLIEMVAPKLHTALLQTDPVSTLLTPRPFNRICITIDANQITQCICKCMNRSHLRVMWLILFIASDHHDFLSFSSFFMIIELVTCSLANTTFHVNCARTSRETNRKMKIDRPIDRQTITYHGWLCLCSTIILMK